MSFQKIKPEELSDNVFKLIGADWMLVTAGTLESFNTMTASWGGMGILWNKKVCFSFIKPIRYTYEFMEKSQEFTLSFFTEDHRKALEYCGSHSGRDIDKIAKTGLTPIKEDNVVYFEEARLVLKCKKIYFQTLNSENFLDPKIERLYPEKSYHRMYISEIKKCLIKE